MKDAKDTKALKDLGKRIERLRKASGFSYREFANEVDLSLSYIQKLESGQSNPSYTTLIKLAESLKIDISELF